MDIEKETNIEYRVITLFLIITSVIVTFLVIALTTNLLELRPDETAIQVLSSEATENSLTIYLENIHSNKLLITEVLVDGSHCNICTNNKIIQNHDKLTVSCANIPHIRDTYQHTVSIKFTDSKKSYNKISTDLVSGSVTKITIGNTNVTPVYEKIILTRDVDELIYDTISNSCPQISLTGSSENKEEDFDVFLYTFDKNAEIQQNKKWDLNTFDAGISLARTVLGKTTIFGSTINPTQGSDTITLQTNDLSSKFTEKVQGSSQPDIAKKLFLDDENSQYVITEIDSIEKRITVVKKDSTTQELWAHELPLEKLSTFLTATLHNDKIHIITTTPNGQDSELVIFNSAGTQEQTINIPGIVRDLIFDTQNNAIFVGDKKGQASSDAQIHKYNSQWRRSWTKTWGDSDKEKYNDAVVAADGTIFVVGSFEISLNNHRSFLHQYTTNGILRDSYLFRVSQSLNAEHIELTQEGLYVIGEIYDDAQHDVFIAKFR